MVVYTENPDFAANFLWEDAAQGFSRMPPEDEDRAHLLRSLSGSEAGEYQAPQGSLPLRHLLIREFVPTSNYQQLLTLLRDGQALPDRFAYLAGSGDGFQGFKGRSWAALPGNLHLAVHLAPGRVVDRFGAAFIALATLSVVDALDQVRGMEARAGIKWVNDILVDGAKVAGSLAFTQSQDRTVTSAVLGIGINVLSTPQVERALAVPRVASVRDLIPDSGSPRAGSEDPRSKPAHLLRKIFHDLVTALDRNYAGLLEDGAGPLLSRYRDRCVIVGREVIVYRDRPDGYEDILAEGRVEGLGENLELIVKGHGEPISSGRLVLRNAVDEIEHRAGTARRAERARSVVEG